MGDYTVYWNGQPLPSGRGAGGREDESTHPSVSVSADRSGFVYVLAQPVGSKRAVTLDLKSNPEPGVYEFQPPDDGFDFGVRLEYRDEPYPEPIMNVFDVTTPLATVTPGDQIEIGLRESQTASPGIKSITGRVTQVLDFSGLVPDRPNYIREPTTVLSVLVSLVDDPSSDTSARDLKLIGQTRLQPIGDSFGTLDVVGSEHPLDLQWEGRADTPALQVEFARLHLGQESELTVENESLPDVRFDALADHSLTERISILESVFSSALDQPVEDETLEFFAASVDEPPEERTITVRYESSRSENTLTKSGTFRGVRSVYYADDNQTRHQLRFSDTDGRHYILLDPESDARVPASVYSVSFARHWDTDLGPLLDFELST